MRTNQFCWIPVSIFASLLTVAAAGCGEGSQNTNFGPFGDAGGSVMGGSMGGGSDGGGSDGGSTGGGTAGGSTGGGFQDSGSTMGGFGGLGGGGSDGGSTGGGSDDGGSTGGGAMDAGAAGGSMGGGFLGGGSGGGSDGGAMGSTDGGSLGGTDAGSMGSSDGGSMGGGSSSFPAVDDFASTGPFDTTSEAAGSSGSGGGGFLGGTFGGGGGTDGAACTIYRPSNLGQDGLKHPVLIWGNGTSTSPSSYSAGLSHMASHGFIVAAADTSNAGSGQEMLACLDWVLEQNDTSGPYQGNVATDKVGAFGYSQGGGGTLMAGTDSRVDVTAPLAPWMGASDLSSASNQNGPMFMTSGSADSVASIEAQQQPIFDASNVPTVWGTLQGANHFESTGDFGGFKAPTTAWFRYHLMNDQSAESMFFPSGSCELCSSSEWTVERKNF